MCSSYINYHMKSEVSIMLHCQLRMFNPLHSISDQEQFEKHLCNPCIPKERNGAAHPSYIIYRLKSEVSIMLHCRLCSTSYTAVRIKNCLKSTSVFKMATMKNTDDFCYEGKPSRVTVKSILFAIRMGHKGGP